MSTDYEYKLRVSKVKKNLVVFDEHGEDYQEIEKVLTELSLFVNYQYGSDIMDEHGEIYDTFNWYACTDTLKIFSSDCPDVLFSLDEYNHDDMEWFRHYIMNGQCQTVVAIPPPFDISKFNDVVEAGK
jgi:hypothetical protein